jgi:hypothetical protein
MTAFEILSEEIVSTWLSTSELSIVKVEPGASEAQDDHPQDERELSADDADNQRDFVFTRFCIGDQLLDWRVGLVARNHVHSRTQSAQRPAVAAPERTRGGALSQNANRKVSSAIRPKTTPRC